MGVWVATLYQRSATIITLLARIEALDRDDYLLNIRPRLRGNEDQRYGGQRSSRGIMGNFPQLPVGSGER